MRIGRKTRAVLEALKWILAVVVTLIVIAGIAVSEGGFTDECEKRGGAARWDGRQMACIK